MHGGGEDYLEKVIGFAAPSGCHRSTWSWRHQYSTPSSLWFSYHHKKKMYEDDGWSKPVENFLTKLVCLAFGNILATITIGVLSVRASIVSVANVSNAKYLAHLPHLTQKWRFMRCAKSQKLYNITTIPLQICNGTDRCCKNFIVLYSLFSLLSLHFFFSLLSHSPVPSLFSLYRFPLSSTSLGCSPVVTTA